VCVCVCVCVRVYVCVCVCVCVCVSGTCFLPENSNLIAGRFTSPGAAVADVLASAGRGVLGTKGAEIKAWLGSLTSSEPLPLISEGGDTVVVA
jgi:hypothetical protein